MGKSLTVFAPRPSKASRISKNALAAVGAGLEHVVKITAYFVDISDLAVFREIRNSTFDIKTPPAATAVQIGKLARDGLLFEIEAIAVVPEK